MIIGHDDVRERLEQSLPPVTLLMGPRSVGKRSLAEYLVNYHSVLPCDVSVLKHLDAATSRGLCDFFSTRPFGPLKAAVVCLDGAGEVPMNVLLKTLEEPPSCAKFLLTSSARVLPTVESRSQVFRLGILSRAQIEVIMARRGMNPQAAANAALRSDGTVAAALSDGPPPESRAVVLSALKAIADEDQDKLGAACDAWSEESDLLLKWWLWEAITGRWNLFQLTESFGLAQNRKWLMSVARDMSRSARPKVKARYVLTAALNRK